MTIDPDTTDERRCWRGECRRACYYPDCCDLPAPASTPAQGDASEACPGCQHAPHASGLCEADTHPGCDCGEASAPVVGDGEVEALGKYLGSRPLFWGTHADRWNDVEWQTKFWQEVASVALASPVIAGLVADREHEAWERGRMVPKSHVAERNPYARGTS